jgi:RHS repeat-associated protein
VRITWNGNGTATAYAYERETFRLRSLVTKRSSDNREMQNITYTYDPVGNITNIIDSSDDRVFNNGQQVDPEMKYAYDALYRLSEASGREHTALSNKKDAYKDTNSFKQSAFASVNDMQKLANYKEQYSYDKSGNMYRLGHYNNTSSLAFSRDIRVDQYTNRAVLVDDPNNPPVITNYFDVNGNQIVLEHLKEISYNYRDNISKAVVIKRTGGTDDAEYYVYDSQGNRVRKVSEKVINTTTGAVEVEDKIYLGGVEIKRIRQQSSLILQRSTLHIMDDRSRIAISHNWPTDTLNRETTGAADLNKNKTSYQYGNHLGSASLELDTAGNIISYEEYTPYGESSMMVGNNQTEVKLKEYRYTGKERDDFTGLYYYGARYYASWLGRWLTTEPLLRNCQFNESVIKYVNYKYPTSNHNGKPIDAVGNKSNGYIYCKNNPILYSDENGLEDINKIKSDIINYAIIDLIMHNVDIDNINIPDIKDIKDIKYKSTEMLGKFSFNLEIKLNKSIDLTPGSEINPLYLTGINISSEPKSNNFDIENPNKQQKSIVTPIIEVGQSRSIGIQPTNDEGLVLLGASLVKNIILGLSRGIIKSGIPILKDIFLKSSKVSLDANILIGALEKGELKALEASLKGRTPIVSITAAKEFLKKGDINALKEFLKSHGGYIGKAATEQEILSLQNQAASLGRVLKYKDASVVGSALKEDAVIMTRDDRLLKFLQSIGVNTEKF